MELREFMGLPKRDHLAQVLRLQSVRTAWADRFAHEPDAEDLDAAYAELRLLMLEEIERRTQVIPGAVQTVEALRDRGLRIGSTTGYDKAAMEVVSAAGAAAGYLPDVAVTPDGLPRGRPAPYMMFMNAILLDVFPMAAVVKVGDPRSSIRNPPSTSGRSTTGSSARVSSSIPAR